MIYNLYLESRELDRVQIEADTPQAAVDAWENYIDDAIVSERRSVEGIESFTHHVRDDQGRVVWRAPAHNPADGIYFETEGVEFDYDYDTRVVCTDRETTWRVYNDGRVEIDACDFGTKEDLLHTVQALIAFEKWLKEGLDNA